MSQSNTEATFMAALGPCNGLTSSTSVIMNEVTTVAMAYAVAGFAYDALHISSNNTTLGIADMANAFANAGNLASSSGGIALATTPSGNGTPPQALIYTLANIIAVCVNSNPGSSSQCSTLFGYASGVNTPQETATMAIWMAQHPGTSNIGSLYNFPNGTYAFGGGLTSSSPPNDFTVAINYAGANLSNNDSIAIDGSGNAWLTGTSASGMTEISPLGVVQNFAVAPTNATSLNGVAVAASGPVWYGTNLGVSQVTSSGTNVGQYTATNLAASRYMAVDTSGDIWASSGSYVFELDPNGNDLSNGGFTDSSAFVSPNGIGFDGSGGVWVADKGASMLTKLSPAGSKNASVNYTNAGVHQPQCLALDPSNDIWVGNSNSTLSAWQNGGSNISGSSGFSAIGGLNAPTGMAIDSNKYVWTTNGNSTLSAINGGSGPFQGMTALSPSTGYTGGSTAALNSPQAIAIDGDGDVWVVNTNSVTEFIGLAGPVATPLPANLISPYSHPASQP